MGVNILLYKYVHLILGSGIMGLGGFYMALNMGGSFEGSNCWINGYGWIAIALVIFANWNPLYAILGTLVFGFFNTLQIYSGSLAGAFPDALGWLNSIPSHLFKALPFLITAIVLVVTSIRKREGSGQPAALGLNYFREGGERPFSPSAPCPIGDRALSASRWGHRTLRGAIFSHCLRRGAHRAPAVPVSGPSSCVGAGPRPARLIDAKRAEGSPSSVTAYAVPPSPGGKALGAAGSRPCGMSSVFA